MVVENELEKHICKTRLNLIDRRGNEEEIYGSTGHKTGQCCI